METTKLETVGNVASCRTRAANFKYELVIFPPVLSMLNKSKATSAGHNTLQI